MFGKAQIAYNAVSALSSSKLDEEVDAVLHTNTELKKYNEVGSSVVNSVKFLKKHENLIFLGYTAGVLAYQAYKFLQSKKLNLIQIEGTQITLDASSSANEKLIVVLLRYMHENKELSLRVLTDTHALSNLKEFDLRTSESIHYLTRITQANDSPGAIVADGDTYYSKDLFIFKPFISQVEFTFNKHTFKASKKPIASKKEEDKPNQAVINGNSVVYANGYAPKKEQLYLYSQTASLQDFQELLEKAVKWGYSEPSEIKLYVDMYNRWEEAYNFNYRSFNTLAVRESLKNLILSDIDNFLASKSWYLQRGLRYKRSYLFYGPPGTGKTSLISAIAEHYRKNVYSLTANSSSLANLIGSVPKNSILVIEEIDTLFKDRSSEAQSGSDKVSFKEFINIIDGLNSPSDILIFFTTNHYDKIDPALLRPGRMDLKIEISFVNREEFMQMVNIYRTGEESVFEKMSFPENVYTAAQLQAMLLLEPIAENIKTYLENKELPEELKLKLSEELDN
jgi:predicted AAA+ superfamily ATPase